LRVHADAEAFFHEVKDTGTGLARAGAKDQIGTVLAPLGASLRRSPVLRAWSK
jgi:hypothetical protein